MTMTLADYKLLVGNAATLMTILQFLSGMLVCHKFMKKGSTKDVSSLPFVTGFLSSCLWFSYGTLIEDMNIILVNSVGMFLMMSYIGAFYIYTTRKSMIVSQLFGVVTFIICLITYFQWELDREVFRKRFGVLASTMTTLCIAAPLSNLRQVIRMKNSESLPFPIIFSSVMVSTLWYFYGVIIDDPFLQVKNLFFTIIFFYSTLKI
uniref:Sugar transporter SWEET1 n=1 Tax=Clastoptera arizonana TaxID=38151 RepID=A0A1B6EBF2_9HEMI